MRLASGQSPFSSPGVHGFSQRVRKLAKFQTNKRRARSGNEGVERDRKRGPLPDQLQSELYLA